MERARAVNILLVEDNPDHAELTRRALKNGNVLNDVFWVKDGEEALDFLHQRRQYADSERAPRPGLILLDVKLPKVDGHGVLREIKSDPNLRTIPVIMLTTSCRREDVNEAYTAGANSFITKPVSFQAFAETIKVVKLYWVATNVLDDEGMTR